MNSKNVILNFKVTKTTLHMEATLHTKTHLSYRRGGLMKSRASKISRRGFTKLLVSIPVVGVIFDGFSVVSAQSQKVTSSVKPSGSNPLGWKIIYQAHYGGNSWAAPVSISYVTGYTGGGSWRRKIGLRNVSATTVRSVGLGAHIFNQDNPSVIVSTTALPTIQFKEGLAHDAAVTLDGKDELEKIFRPFVKNGVLDEAYRIEVFVREVVSDAAKWRYEAKLK
jgi:hypothetical protein